jgi:hypothetical protein
MNTEQQNRRTRLMVISLVAIALCFYFGFMIVTGMSN